MDIWEPCNYVSNLAYDRLLVEMCVQQVATIEPSLVSLSSPGIARKSTLFELSSDISDIF